MKIGVRVRNELEKIAAYSIDRRCERHYMREWD